MADPYATQTLTVSSPPETVAVHLLRQEAADLHTLALVLRRSGLLRGAHQDTLDAYVAGYTAAIQQQAMLQHKGAAPAIPPGGPQPVGLPPAPPLAQERELDLSPQVRAAFRQSVERRYGVVLGPQVVFYISARHSETRVYALVWYGHQRRALEVADSVLQEHSL